ncbi:hypothetical protein RUM43_004372 [Polyplax serrata]|uniref:Uncharacterized protein n=1 Tax=Polyplax serrata TaxID=468196 RepID=A0AAN8SAS7_POLSC
MSKAKKGSKVQAVEKNIGPVFADKNGNIVVQVLAKPGAKVNGITGIEEEGVGVQINARPVDGEANSELVSYISTVFGLKKSEITLDRGMKSRQKVLLISKKNLTVGDVIEKLKEEIQQ